MAFCVSQGINPSADPRQTPSHFCSSLPSGIAPALLPSDVNQSGLARWMMPYKRWGQAHDRLGAPDPCLNSHVNVDLSLSSLLQAWHKADAPPPRSSLSPWLFSPRSGHWPKVKLLSWQLPLPTASSLVSFSFYVLASTWATRRRSAPTSAVSATFSSRLVLVRSISSRAPRPTFALLRS